MPVPQELLEMSNVYLMLYPKPNLAKALSDELGGAG
jgi:hypothetical protein